MQNLIHLFREPLVNAAPGIIGAVALLVIGWIVALVIRLLVAKSLRLIKLNDRLWAQTGSSKMNLEHGIASGIFYFLLLGVLLLVFNALDLEIASAPLQQLLAQVSGFLPRLISGIVLILVAWIVATLAKTFLVALFNRTSLDEKLGKTVKSADLGQTLGNVAYWLVFLLFLPAILGALQLTGLLNPVESLVQEILGVVPNIFAAVVIGFVGWLIARIVRDIAINLLSAFGADKLPANMGMKGNFKLSKLIGYVIYIFILIPALTSALDALKMESISRPITDMLIIIFTSLPDILSAGFILFITYWVGKWICQLVAGLLDSMGVNDGVKALGFDWEKNLKVKPSSIVGRIAFFFIMVFAIMEASARLAFHQVNELGAMFIQFGGQVILGAVIMIIGLWLSSIIHKAMMGTGGKNAGFLAGLVRVIILGFVIAMGLRSMGVANDIVNLGFGLTLGSVAIAVALSFGLGGREAAGKQMEYWLSKLRK